jgi:hypothetical protein
MTNPKRLTGVLMIVVPAVFIAGFSSLQAIFDYPAILRQPAGDVLTRFAAGGMLLHLSWYVMTLAALGMIPIAVGVGLLYWPRDRFVAALSVAAGVLAGLVQALGLIRWVILVPWLAQSYLQPNATEGGRAIAASLFDGANLYLGAAVGEHLGYLFTAAWTLLVTVLIWQDHRRMAIVGLIVALAVAFGLLEPAGIPFAAVVNAIGYTGWALWLLVLGVVTLRKSVPLPAA